MIGQILQLLIADNKQLFIYIYMDSISYIDSTIRAPGMGKNNTQRWLQNMSNKGVRVKVWWTNLYKKYCHFMMRLLFIYISVKLFKCVLYCQIKPVHYLMINVETALMTSEDVRSLPRGLYLNINITYHDKYGSVFFVAPISKPIYTCNICSKVT